MKQGLLSKKLTKFIVISGIITAIIISLIQVIHDHKKLTVSYYEQVNVTIDTISPALEQSIWDVELALARLQLEAIEHHSYVSFVKLEIPYFDDIHVGDIALAEDSFIIQRTLIRENEPRLGELTVFLDKQKLLSVFRDSFLSHIVNNVFVISITASILYFILKKLITLRLYRLVDNLRDAGKEGEDLKVELPKGNVKFDEIDELNTAIKTLWDIKQSSMSALAKNERRWRLALDSTSDGIWDWNIKSGHVYFSDNWKLMLGFAPDEIGDDYAEWAKLVHPDDLEFAKSEIERHFKRETDSYTISLRMFCKDGRYKWLLDRGRVIERDSDGNPIRMIGTHTDINQLVEAQKQLEVLAMVYQQSSEGMLITNSNSEIIDVNDAFVEITGYSKRDVLGKLPTFIISEQHSNPTYQGVLQSIVDTGSWKGEVNNKNKSGQEYTVWLSVTEIRDKNANLQGYVGIFTDITSRKKQENLIHHQANYDSLTNLVNRRFFLELLQKQIAYSKREQNEFWLMYLDLDHFKEVNDTLGHDYGDELLKQWSHRVQSSLRESDILARVGGDEYAIVFCQVKGVKTIDDIANNLINILNKPYDIRGTEVYIGVSIGVVQYPKDGENHSSLIRAADQTLYKAKQQGRNQHVFYTPELQQVLDEKVNLSKKMRKGLNTGQFRVYLQPIVRFSDNKVVKAEALLRWKDPDDGFIRPDIFIPIAEEIGFIEALTEFVIDDVICQQLTWQQQYQSQLQVSINISPIGFRTMQKQKSNWYEHVKSIDSVGELILFEITESVLVDNDQQTMDLLIEFRDLGIEVGIDDFGTGYSSLSYLHRLDIDYLKIDKQFVDDISSNPDIKALCEAIIVMAHKLGLKVIAEGVENQQQAELLKSLDCDYYQGYLCSPAIAMDEFERHFLVN